MNTNEEGFFDKEKLNSIVGKAPYDWAKRVESEKRWWFIRKRIIALQFFWLDLKEWFKSFKK